MKRSMVTSVVFLFIGVLSLTATAARRADDPTWPLYVNVEQDGKLITGLTSSNFRVFLDDRGQQFELQTPETPASVVLLLEYSRQSGMFLEELRNALQGFMDHAPEENWYGLVTFDRETNIAVDFTKNKGEIRAALANLPEPMWDDINTYDAISKMLQRMSKLPGRRVIILVGSGFDTFSRTSLDDIEKAAESGNVSIYCLGAGSVLRTYYAPYLDISSEMDLLSARALLTTLAEKTGGEAWFPDFEIAFHDAMEGVMQDLATQYKLVVKGAIPADGRLHKIRVEAFMITNDKRTNFNVRVRQGFRGSGN